MSEARNGRFEIDMAGIERELRRSAEAARAPQGDPLQELARIVGKTDPFRGIVEARQTAQPLAANHDQSAYGYAPEPIAVGAPDLGPAEPAYYDPVAATYGSEEAALDRDDIAPLRPRRSRGKLAAVAAMLLATTGAIAGGLYWYKPMAVAGRSGTPPVVTADPTPVKKVPENPGGMEVPNQDRQIYQKTAQDGGSRVIDGREQPIDVREAARNMPAVADRSGPSAVTGRMPVTGPVVAEMPPAGASAPASPAGANPVNSALGEPRRVRTVAVKPDGTLYASADAGAMPSAPAASPTPAVSTTASVAQPPSAPPSAAEAVATDGGAAAQSAVKVLPPSRPRTREADNHATATAEPAADTQRYQVQVAVKPTEKEARAAYTELQDKFAGDLDGKPAKVTRGEVDGKTVHRVRIGPMAKADATALCTKLKASGGTCRLISVN